MPELPEVETIRRTLEKQVKGLLICDVQVYCPSVVQGWEDREFVDLVKGRLIVSVERRGKFLLMTLDQGWSMLAHMRMTGRLIYHPTQYQPEKHTHVVFQLERGELHFSDVRRFGRIQLIPTEQRVQHPSLAKLGPEPLEGGFTSEVLGRNLRRKRVILKAALLDQTVVAGLGNIYVDEALFRAGISPERATQSLTDFEVERLQASIREVLGAGIEAQGTSFRDYRDANGEKGSFQESLQVYGRGKMPCQVCGTGLERKRLAGRTTVFCASCQK